MSMLDMARGSWGVWDGYLTTARAHISFGNARIHHDRRMILAATRMDFLHTHLFILTKLTVFILLKRKRTYKFEIVCFVTVM